MMKYLIFLTLIFLMLSCQNSSKEGLITSFDCKEIDLNKALTMSRKTQNFTLLFPTGWDVEIIHEDQLNGIFAMDTISFVQEEAVVTLTINEIQTSKKLNEYFQNELNGLSKDNIDISNIGNFLIDEYEALWVWVSREREVEEILIYTKGPQQSAIFLILLHVQNSKNSQILICELIHIVHSLSFENPMVSELVSLHIL